MEFRGFRHSKPASPSPRPAAAYPQAPGTSIGYDPTLISRLRSDHHRILNLFTQTQSLVTTGDYAGVKRTLGELRVALQDHLTLSSIKFYVYVSRQLAPDPAKSAILSAHRREMLDNSREIMDFLRTYSAIRLDDQSVGMFQAELLVIGSALVKRIEREESTLYPLYQASY